MCEGTERVWLRAVGRLESEGWAEGWDGVGEAEDSDRSW